MKDIKTSYYIDIGDPEDTLISYRCRVSFKNKVWRAELSEQYPHFEKGRNNLEFSMLLTKKLNEQFHREIQQDITEWLKSRFLIIYNGIPVNVESFEDKADSGFSLLMGTEYEEEIPSFVSENALLSEAMESYTTRPGQYMTIPVFYATDRKRTNKKDLNNYYGNERGTFETGRCEVSIPLDHALGEIERPKWWKLEFEENPEKHVTIVTIDPQEENAFYPGLEEITKNSSENDAFIFIHGYNVDFSEAIYRTAQIAYDISFEGAPILYSWPSKGTLAGYFADEDSVKWTVRHLKEFLSRVMGLKSLKKLHLIAHSMGNRALSDALMALKEISSTPIHQVILTAPDIDSQIFTEMIVPSITSSAQRITLYASSRDRALRASKAIRTDIQRAGDAGEDIIVIDGIDTVDASHVDTDVLGHSYFSETESLINDIFSLVKNNLPPSKRNLRRKLKPVDKTYWAFPRNY
jgi:esterase/lipase superfamily enzyme